MTTWQSDIAYADTLPAIVDWVGYGSYAYNEGLGGCNIVDGGAGWTESFTRIDPQTVRVRLTLDWVEGDNGVDGYGCGVNDVLNAGLLDGGGTEVAFELIALGLPHLIRGLLIHRTSTPAAPLRSRPWWATGVRDRGGSPLDSHS